MQCLLLRVLDMCIATNTIPVVSMILMTITLLVRLTLITTGNIVAGTNMADCQKICMPYIMLELQTLTWRVLLWRVLKMKIW